MLRKVKKHLQIKSDGKPGLFWFVVITFTFFTGPLFAADNDNVPPSGSVEVIHEKVKKEFQNQLEDKLPEKIDLQMPKPEEKGAMKIVTKIQRIRLEPHPTLTRKQFESLVRPQELQPLLTPYEGRRVSFKELSELNSKIEQVLRGRGYFAVVRIPPQEIKDGEVILEVLLSRMGDLHIEGAGRFRESKIRAFWKIPKGEILDYGQMVKSILAMNENPDRSVKPLVKPGAEPGTTDVILKVEKRIPIHPLFTWDNQGSKTTGKYRYTFTFRDSDLLGLDDTFVVGTVFGKTFGALVLQHLVPIGTTATQFSWGFSHAQVNPRKEFESSGINGISQSYNVALRQKIYRSETSLLTGSIGFDFKEKTTVVSNATTAWDKLRVLSVGNNFMKKHHNGISTIGSDFYFGMSPRGNGFPLNSRQAASRFFKYKFLLERLQSLPWGTEGDIKLQGQVSPDKLTPQEEFFFGGMTTVRGYPESDYGGDQACLLNIEYRFPFFIVPEDWILPFADKPFRDQTQLFGFFDHGYGRLQDPSSSEERTRGLTGLGGGIRYRFNSYLSLDAIWGYGIGNTPLTEGGRSRLHFQLTLQY